MLIGYDKVCGSAQRRRNGAVLQHGSLLWRTSPAAPELPGLADICPLPIGVSIDAVADLWFDALGRRVGLAWHADELDDREIRRAGTLAESRYGGDEWTKNRGRGSGPR